MSSSSNRPEDKKKKKKNHIKVCLFFKKKLQITEDPQKGYGKKRPKLFKLSSIAFKILNMKLAQSPHPPHAPPSSFPIDNVTTSNAKQNIVFIIIHLQAIVWNVRLALSKISPKYFFIHCQVSGLTLELMRSATEINSIQYWNTHTHTLARNHTHAQTHNQSLYNNVTFSHCRLISIRVCAISFTVQSKPHHKLID